MVYGKALMAPNADSPALRSLKCRDTKDGTWVAAVPRDDVIFFHSGTDSEDFVGVSFIHVSFRKRPQANISQVTILTLHCQIIVSGMTQA